MHDSLPASPRSFAHDDLDDGDLIPAQPHTSPLGAALSIASSPGMHHASPAREGLHVRSGVEDDGDDHEGDHDDAVHSIPPLPDTPVFDEFSPLSLR